TTPVGIGGLRMVRVDVVLVVAVLGIPERLVQLGRTSVGELAAGRGELVITHVVSHLGCSAQGGDIEAADPRDLAVPRRVERVVLLGLEEAVGFTVVIDEVLRRLLDPWPDPSEK